MVPLSTPMRWVPWAGIKAMVTCKPPLSKKNAPIVSSRLRRCSRKTGTTGSVRISCVSAEWLDWVRRLQAIAQSGLTYAEDPYDIERYEQIRRIAAEMAVSRSGASVDRTDDLFAGESGYATPKLDIGAVVVDEEGAVLLVREKEDGLWTLPAWRVGRRGRVTKRGLGEGGEGRVRLLCTGREAGEATRFRVA